MIGLIIHLLYFYYLLPTMHDRYASHALSDIWMRYGVIITISFHIQQVSVFDLLNVFPAP
jgi:hypothetical protein